LLSHASGSDEDGGLGLLDYEEVDMGQLTKVVKVKGCLKQCEQFWRDTFPAPSFMTSTVSNGYIPPFYVAPPPLFLTNRLSAFAHAEFVTAEVASLVDSGCVSNATSALMFVAHCWF